MYFILFYCTDMICATRYHVNYILYYLFLAKKNCLYYVLYKLNPEYFFDPSLQVKCISELNAMYRVEP